MAPKWALDEHIPKRLGVLENKLQDIIEQGVGHQAQEDEDADFFGVFHKLVARLSARDHLVEEEEGVAAIECGNRQDIHKRQHQRDEGRQFPETLPNPRGGEE